MVKVRLFFVLTIFVCAVAPLKAQRLAVSTNIVDIFTLTPNAELELSINHKESFALSVEANPFQISDRLSFDHLSVSGEYRFWLDQILYSHYISAVVQLSSNDYRIGSWDFSGEVCALGVGYGYSLLINRNLNIVPNVSLGCGYKLTEVGDESRFMPMLLNLGVSFQYLIK